MWLISSFSEPVPVDLYLLRMQNVHISYDSFYH